MVNEKYNCSRTGHDINMKLETVTKLDKRNTSTSKKFDRDIMSANCYVIVFFFQLITTLQPSGSWIAEAWSIKLIFSLIATFYLTEPENRTKNSLKHLLHYCFK